MPKFTPGPWTYKVIPIWTPANPTDGIPCFECNEFGGEVWIKQAKINARLIAKAPEMYKMLKRFDEALSGFDKHIREGFTSLFYDYSVLKSEIDGE